MFIVQFKAEFGLALPSLSLLGCLILAGCADSSFQSANGQIEIVPNEIAISPWSKPVAVTATWKTTEDGVTFEKWLFEGNTPFYTLKADSDTKTTTKISVECSQNLATPEALHKNPDGLVRLAQISAQVQRNGESKRAWAFLTINIALPYLSVTEVFSNRTASNTQKVDIVSILSLEVKNPPDQANYAIDLSAARGRVWVCVPNQNCNPETLGAATIIRRTESSATKIFFELKQTINTALPRTVGRIEYYYSAKASSVSGGTLSAEGPIIW